LKNVALHWITDPLANHTLFRIHRSWIDKEVNFKALIGLLGELP
jgi:hypothetical protein